MFNTMCDFRISVPSHSQIVAGKKKVKSNSPEHIRKIYGVDGQESGMLVPSSPWPNYCNVKQARSPTFNFNQKDASAQ